MTTYPLLQHKLTISEHRVLVDGEALNVSSRGHQALIMLLESEGQVLGKDALIEHLWQGVVVSDDSLFKVIQEVRQAIKQLGVVEQVVANVYGKGYQWVAPTQTTPASVSVGTSPWWLVSSLVLLIGGMIWLWYEPHTPMTTDEWFAQQVSNIKSGVTPDLTLLQASSDQHPLDQLKLGYLHGLSLHQSGQYEPSIQSLKQGLEAYLNEPAHPAQADSHYLLARMYIYRDDRPTLKHHLDEAEQLYQSLGDESGMLDVAVERARYHQVLLEFEHSVELLKAVYQHASETDNAHHQLRALSNLAYAHQQLDQPQQREAVLQEALELSLDLSDGRYAAYSYGELAEIYALRREYGRAMKHAELALRYVMNQRDTNVFQQGFSAFYLLLRPLGHTGLAERYLKQAIEIQSLFNDQGVLVNAELNLAKVYLSQGRVEVASAVLSALLTEQLTAVEQLETEALLAYSLYLQGDNIGAYTRAQPLLEAGQANRPTRLYAQAAFVLGAWQLEREQEAGASLQAMANWIDQANPDEMALFLQLAEATAADLTLPGWGAAERQSAQASLVASREDMIRQTQPNEQLMQDLDRYLQAIRQ
jgi:DNA-binding winged helix-turn-helix (wHTH) protein/tetratricopeptide (TPR) repeat protein